MKIQTRYQEQDQKNNCSVLKCLWRIFRFNLKELIYMSELDKTRPLKNSGLHNLDTAGLSIESCKEGKNDVGVNRLSHIVLV